MAGGFLGFMQGFASTGAEIVQQRDKQQQAIDTYVAERAAQAAIDKKIKEDAAQAELDKAAAVDNRFNAAAQGTSAPVAQPTAATTPINPQAAAPAQVPQAAPLFGKPASVDAQGNPVSQPLTGQPMAPAAKADATLGLFGKQMANPTADITPTVTTPTTSSNTTMGSPFDSLPKEEQIARAKAALSKLDKTERDSPDGGFNAARTLAADTYNDKASKDAIDRIKLKVDNQKSGLDENGDPVKPVEVNPETAKKMGVPVLDPELNPLNQLSAKDRSKSIRETTAAMGKVDSVVLHKADKIVAAAEAFKKLNEGTTTGGSSNALLLGRKQFDSNIQQLESLTKTLALGDIGSGSGISRATQGEFYKILQANPNATNDIDANIAMANQIIGNAKAMKEETLWRQKYFQVNKTIAGSDTAYAEYLAKNPFYDEGSTNFSPNPNRQTPEQYFGGEPASSTEPSKEAAPAIQDLKDKYKNFFGASGSNEVKGGSGNDTLNEEDLSPKKPVTGPDGTVYRSQADLDKAIKHKQNDTGGIKVGDVIRSMTGHPRGY